MRSAIVKVGNGTAFIDGIKGDHKCNFNGDVIYTAQSGKRIYWYTYRQWAHLTAATVAKNATVQREGNRDVSRDIEYYNLDMIISVGYRVNSLQGTQFRIWASTQLKELMIKGFVMDDAKLKGEKSGYFDELQERDRLVNDYHHKIDDPINEMTTCCSICKSPFNPIWDIEF